MPEFHLMPTTAINEGERVTKQVTYWINYLQQQFHNAMHVLCRSSVNQLCKTYAEVHPDV